MMKRVSVIIPFYSKKEWLYEAVDSVLAQTYPIYEIILVNDGSKEDISDFLAIYGEIITYIYQENAGPAAARNKAMRTATGDYIAFEDSDDVWLPTKIEKQVAFMEDTGAMWCHTGFLYWWPDTNKMRNVNTSRDYDDVLLQRMVSTKIATPALMINRKIFEIGDFEFPEGVRNGEDDQLYTKLARHFKLALVNEPLVKVRMRGTNSQTHAIERFNLRVSNYYLYKKENLPITPMIKVIYSFYRLYALIFGTKSTPIKDFLAKCVWIVPYGLERVYVRYIYKYSKKDEKYRLNASVK